MHNFNTHTTYYFWDKKHNCLGHITFSSVTSTQLVFYYMKKRYHCDAEYAIGKVFENRMDVPQYKEKFIEGQKRAYIQSVENERLKRHKELNSKPISSIDPNARVEFGD